MIQGKTWKALNSQETWRQARKDIFMFFAAIIILGLAIYCVFAGIFCFCNLYVKGLSAL